VPTPAEVNGANAEGPPQASESPSQPAAPAQPEPWSPALRIAFRFCFIYFTLYGLSNQIIGGLIVIPEVNLPDLSVRWPLRQITLWTAAHVFRVTHPLVYIDTGSGDRQYDWILAPVLLTFAIVATMIWSALDRRRKNYTTLYKWFRLAIRLALVSELLLYGLIKVIPLQMPFPSLTRLVEPYGNFSPMATLWYSLGASPAYEVFTGCAETLAGLLLLVPRTCTLGALIGLADLTQVFVLNMTYDVPVKLFSFHLILYALFLLAPQGRRIFTFFFSDRAVAPHIEPPLFRSRRGNRIALALQVLFGIYFVGINVYGGVERWQNDGPGRPKPSLYGIWDVQDMTVDGQTRPPLLTDNDRWRRVIFDIMTRTTFQRMDETFANFGSTLNEKNQALNLTKVGDKNWKADFTFNRPSPDQLQLDGAMDGHKIHMQLKLLDRSKLMLVSRGFHWINDFPFQR
jgi:hypothetical protein